MRGELLEVETVVESDDLRLALEPALSDHFRHGVTIVKMDRRFSQYSSSYILEELDVELSDGSSLALIFKDMSRNAIMEGATRVKPKFVYNPTREIDTYRHVLSGDGVSTAKFYGAVTDPNIQRYWLFLERLPPVMLWQLGNFGDWLHAARWLARMHAHLAGEAENRRAPHLAHLLVHDRGFYECWIERAHRFVHEGGDRKAAEAIDWLASRYGQVVERLTSLPVTIIHGEFFASNVLVDARPEGLRVCPVDWEMAGLGCGLVDLAGLTSGDWTPSQRESMALAYYQAMPAEARTRTDERSFLRDFEFCRLHQSVQWVGWTPGWTPPPEHAHCWFSEAIRSAEILGL